MSITCSPLLINRNSASSRYYEDLIKGKIPAIIIPNFLDSAICEKLVRNIITSKTSHGCGITQKVGESVNSYISKKIEYFKKTKLTNKHLRNIFSHTDPRETMLNQISKTFKKKIKFADENSMLYSEGIIRLHIPGESVYIHRDNASFDASDFLISKLSGQLSAVLHLQSCESGGELVIFNKFWNLDDEKFRNPVFGYSRDIVSETPYTSIICNQGDLVIINPNKYHSVNMIRGRLKRITLGFFFASSSESSFHAWS